MSLIDWVGKTGAVIIGSSVIYCLGYFHGQSDYKTTQESQLEMRVNEGIDKTADITKKTFKKVNEISQKLPEIVDDYIDGGVEYAK